MPFTVRPVSSAVIDTEMILVYHAFASARNHANGSRPTPPGPEGSNGKRQAVAP